MTIDEKPFAVSPGDGPVPAVLVPRAPGQSSINAVIRHAVTAAARLALRRASTGGTMSDIPADLKYSDDHLWVRPDAGTGLVRVGVTDYAQQSLGDVVAVTLPGPGDTVEAGEACGDIESVKSVSDLITPLTGTVRTRNDDLPRTPELVNTDPYGRGWMFEVETDPATLDGRLAALMDARAYRDLAGA
ncbi:glycine cleavage system protein GcvH [Actinomadura sp. NPDC048955]|uniref:glycine cleavage system protein GcvH n=1 Tax=Actinomadura sp. NPDC048955 TaxID=3158228 RepID=UPI0033C41A9F